MFSIGSVFLSTLDREDGKELADCLGNWTHAGFLFSLFPGPFKIDSHRFPVNNGIGGIT